MKQLKTQRDAAVVAATKAQDERYRAATGAGFQRATQAKDPGVEAIKAELLTLGPLRELPALSAATAVKPALPSTMFGGWTAATRPDGRRSTISRRMAHANASPAARRFPRKSAVGPKTAKRSRSSGPMAPFTPSIFRSRPASWRATLRAARDSERPRSGNSKGVRPRVSGCRLTVTDVAIWYVCV